MTGILLATHGKFAEGILDSARMLMGEVEAIDTVSLEEGENIESFTDKMADKIESLNDGDGVLILVDILGGSPFNATAANLLKKDCCECITGLNLPMLLGVLEERDSTDIKSLADELVKSGRDGIVDVRKRLG